MLYAQDEDATKLFKNLEPSVVLIKTESGIGSGIVLTSSGLILTNQHVVDRGEKISVEILVPNMGKRERKFFPNVVLQKIHPTLDLAILKVDTINYQLKAARLSRSKDDAQPGGTCYAMGFPYVPGQSKSTISITKGIISSTNRQINKVDYIQLDAAINPGNSGGALINDKGIVIGIPTARYRGADNIGLACPIYELTMDQFKEVASSSATVTSNIKSNTDPSSAEAKLAVPKMNVPEIKLEKRSITFNVEFEDATSVEMIDAPSGMTFQKEKNTLIWKVAPFSQVTAAKVLFLIKKTDGSEEYRVHEVP